MRSPSLVLLVTAVSALAACAPTLSRPPAAPAPAEPAPVVPVELSATISPAVCARMSDGTVRCWGRSGVQVGEERSRPVEVAGVAGAVHLGAGTASTCALEEDGDLRCWGLRASNQAPMGVGGGRGARLVARDVTDFGFDYDAVCFTTQTEPLRCLHSVDGPNPACAGGAPCDPERVVTWEPDAQAHPSVYRRRARAEPGTRFMDSTLRGPDNECGIDASGAVACIGGGVGGDHIATEPQHLAGLIDGVQIALSGSARCVLRRNRSVACWGDDPYGELGIRAAHERCEGDHPCVRMPTQVPSLQDVQELAFGRHGHDVVCAVTRAGEVQCMMPSDAPSSDDPSSPSFVPFAPERVEVPAGVTQIVAALDTFCVLTEAHEVWCWGGNLYGQAGRGRTLYSEEPVQIPGLSDVVQVDVDVHGLAIHEDETVSRWGPGPAAPMAGLTDVAQVSGVCARRRDGGVWCWGANAEGELGNGTQRVRPGDERDTPVQVPGLRDITRLTTSPGAICALREDGAAFCWGLTWVVALHGQRDTYALLSPFRVRGLPPARELALLDHPYAIAEDGSTWTWADGDRRPHQVDLGPVAHLPTSATMNRCFIMADGSVRCGEAGIVVEGVRDTVQLTVGMGGQQSSDPGQGCALSADATVRCWGHALRLIAPPNIDPAVREVLGDARQVSMNGEGTACAARRDGSVWCWGSNEIGLLGGSPIQHAPPMRVDGL